MSAQHTPGRWEVSAKNRFVVVAECDDGELARVADCDWRFLSREETEANARLIAAAPEMLEALENSLDSLEYVQSLGDVMGWGVRAERIVSIRAAIAKARGQA